MSSRSFTTEEVDSSPRLLLEQTTSTPRCRSGECIHNQLVSIFFGSVVLQYSFFVVLHLCTRRMISRQSPLKQTDSSWILNLE